MRDTDVKLQKKKRVEGLKGGNNLLVSPILHLYLTPKYLILATSKRGELRAFQGCQANNNDATTLPA